MAESRANPGSTPRTRRRKGADGHVPRGCRMIYTLARRGIRKGVQAPHAAIYVQRQGERGDIESTRGWSRVVLGALGTHRERNAHHYIP